MQHPIASLRSYKYSFFFCSSRTFICYVDFQEFYQPVYLRGFIFVRVYTSEYIFAIAFHVHDETPA